MHNICTSFIALASVCLARPPLNNGNSSTSNVMPMGFPPGDLPPSDELRDIAGNLLLPLDPSQNKDLEQRLKFEKAPTGPLKLSHLIYSISLTTLSAWKDTTNAPIRERQEIRLRPYTDILHTIRPGLSSAASEAGALTPTRVGIVYCWMMRELLLQPAWPGLITADIFYTDKSLRPWVPLGDIAIKSKPQANTASALTPSENSTTLEKSIAPQGNISFITTSNNNDMEFPVLRDAASRERAWLSCFIQIMLKIVWHPPSAYVRDYFPLSTGGVLWTIRSKTDPQQMAYVRFATLTLELTWRKLANTLLSVGAKAAQNDRWQNEESVRIFEGSIFIADITFKRV